MIFILCFGFVGYEEANKKPTEIVLAPSKIDAYDLALYDTKNEKQIYLGMSKKDVDSILSESIQDELIKTKYSYSIFNIA